MKTEAKSMRVVSLILFGWLLALPSMAASSATLLPDTQPWPALIFEPGGEKNQQRVSCGQYLAAVEGNAIGISKTFDYGGASYFDFGFALSQWIRGFLSGVNAEHARERRQVVADNASIDVWLRKFCEQNLTADFTRAVILFASQSLKPLP